MKTLHLSIITGSGIATVAIITVIVMTLTSLSDNTGKINNNGIEQRLPYFTNVVDTNPAPESFTIPSFNNIWYHAPGDKIVLRGQILSSSGKPLEGIIVNGSITTDQGTNVITNHTISYTNGNFYIMFQTPMKMDLFPESDYNIHLYSIYNNEAFAWGKSPSSGFYDSLRFEEMKRFTFYADGKNSTAELKGNGISQVSLTLDKTQKKITLAGNIANSQSYFDLYIPSDLLGGSLTVERSPTEIIETNATDVRLWGYYGSSFGEVRMYPGVEEIKYFPYYSGNTKLEIFGTTVVPEFPLVAPILVISFVSLFIFYRFKLIPLMSNP